MDISDDNSQTDTKRLSYCRNTFGVAGFCFSLIGAFSLFGSMHLPTETLYAGLTASG